MQRRRYPPLTPEVEAAGAAVVDAAIAVHRRLGPGLLESVYALALQDELRGRGLIADREVAVTLELAHGGEKRLFYIDLLVEGSVIVELKATDELHDRHVAQTLTYLRLSGHRLAYLVNFNGVRLKDGLRRLIR